MLCLTGLGPSQCDPCPCPPMCAERIEELGCPRCIYPVSICILISCHLHESHAVWQNPDSFLRLHTTAVCCTFSISNEHCQMAASVVACLLCVQIIDMLLQRSCDGSMLAIGQAACRGFAVPCCAVLCRAAMLASLGSAPWRPPLGLISARRGKPGSTAHHNSSQHNTAQTDTSRQTRRLQNPTQAYPSLDMVTQASAVTH